MILRQSIHSINKFTSVPRSNKLINWRLNVRKSIINWKNKSSEIFCVNGGLFEVDSVTTCSRFAITC
jgi:hypothetical protein